MRKIITFLVALRPKNIHDLNRLIESGYALWTKVYGFVGERDASAAKFSAAVDEIVASHQDAPDVASAGVADSVSVVPLVVQP